MGAGTHQRRFTKATVRRSHSKDKYLPNIVNVIADQLDGQKANDNLTEVTSSCQTNSCHD
jgi:hypothetical protein